MRHPRSRTEEFHENLKLRMKAYIPELCMFGLALFSLGIGKAYNWKIGLFVFFVLIGMFKVGYGLAMHNFSDARFEKKPPASEWRGISQKRKAG